MHNHTNARRGYVQLIPERLATSNLDRWYASISTRAAFKEQVAVVLLT